MGKLKKILEKQLNTLFQENNIIFWYDSKRSFESFIDSFKPKNFKVFIYQDSFFQLKYQIEQFFCQDKIENLLVYIPIDRHSKIERHLFVKINPLTEIEKASHIYEPSLDLIAQQALKELYSTDKITQLVSEPTISLDELDKLSESEVPLIHPKIKVIFEKDEPISILLNLLTDSEYLQKIQLHQAETEIIEFTSIFFGYEITGTTDLEEIKNKIIFFLIIFDFKSKYKPANNLIQLQNIKIPIQREQKIRCQEILKYIKENTKFIPLFSNWSKRIEQQHQICSWNLNLADLFYIDTFECIEYLHLRKLKELVEKLSEDEILKLLITREQSFWSTHNPQIRILWKIAFLIVNLDLKIRKINKVISSKSQNFDELIKLYCSEGYLIDTFYRQMENLITHYDCETPFTEYLNECRKKYYGLLNSLNEFISNRIQDYATSSLLHQHEVFQRVIQPKLRNKTVAFFMVDALRYEMGIELANSLNNAKKLKKYFSLANLPTLTHIGMAALLPDVKAKIFLYEEEGKLIIKTNDQKISNSAERISYIKKKTSYKIKDITLDEILMEKEKIKSKIGNIDLLVVRSNEIDLLGEQNKIFQIRKRLSELIIELKRGIEILSRIGISEFVVSADHGFIFGEKLTDDMKIDPPSGHRIESHRRCWIGKGGAITPSTVKLKAKDIGYQSDVEFIFPSNMGSFKKAGGNSNYFHGGISLQEIVIPVLEFSMFTKSKLKVDEKFEINITEKKITNRIFIAEVKYSVISSHLGKFIGTKPSKTVLCQIHTDKNEIITAMAAQENFNQETKEISLEVNKPNSIIFSLPESYQKGSLKIQIIEPSETIILAESKEYQYEFII